MKIYKYHSKNDLKYLTKHIRSIKELRAGGKVNNFAVCVYRDTRNTGMIYIDVAEDGDYDKVRDWFWQRVDSPYTIDAGVFSRDKNHHLFRLVNSKSDPDDRYVEESDEGGNPGSYWDHIDSSWLG